MSLYKTVKLVIDIGQARMQTRLGCVDAFLEPLETAGNGDRDVIIVSVNYPLYDFYIFLIECHDMYSYRYVRIRQSELVASEAYQCGLKSV